ncbi:MAG: hypothetical protein BWY51_00685 [Parcubacteria group bacterium ADurb.Bin316]|nr:MAG: hypothetical protein BWY51_00685 [Parcubacteria group bacterium ADurb.Bin316]HOZ56142.1 hypothetical protein [bacterium]
MNDEKNESVDEQLLEQSEVAAAGEEKTMDELSSAKQPSIEKKGKGLLEEIGGKKTKRAVVWGLAGAACTCCLAAAIVLATVGLVTVVVFYIQGFFDSSNETAQNSAATTTANNGNR